MYSSLGHVSSHTHIYFPRWPCLTINSQLSSLDHQSSNFNQVPIHEQARASNKVTKLSPSSRSIFIFILKPPFVLSALLCSQERLPSFALQDVHRTPNPLLHLRPRRNPHRSSLSLRQEHAVQSASSSSDERRGWLSLLYVGERREEWCLQGVLWEEGVEETQERKEQEE